MEALRPEVEAAVRKVLNPRLLYWKNDSGARELERLPPFSAPAFGVAQSELRVREGGIDFAAPLTEGQKTGWFYDQAANRALLGRFLPAGARVLDVCSYVGAWAITALKHGAGRATCVDASAAALDFAQRNAAAAGYPLEVVRGDAFEVLKNLHEAGERFDAVILDPPAFIKRRKDIPHGQAAYRKLNQLAMNLIGRDGLLVSCSCSYHLEEAQLVTAVQTAARHSARFAQVLAFGGQSADHPVHPAIPETRYLKALFCRVSRE
jgi:23S rRNA (cytosine1962-C5)-methyltransferase